MYVLVHTIFYKNSTQRNAKFFIFGLDNELCLFMDGHDHLLINTIDKVKKS